MTTGSPTVSVIVPTYNAAGTLGRAISSVRRQSFPVSEIIIVDDCSTDETVELAKQLGADIKILQQPKNTGPSMARNAGAKLASSEYIAFLDADDLWYPQKLETQIAVLEQLKDVALCACMFIRFYGDPPYPAYQERQDPPVSVLSFRDIVRNPYLGTPTVVVRTAVFQELGGFDNSMRYGEDVDLWMRISVNHKISLVNSPLCAVEVSASSTTATGGEEVDRGNIRALDRILERHPEIAKTHLSDLRYARAVVYARLASARLVDGKRALAWEAIADSLKCKKSYGRAWYLLFRSLLPLRR